MPTLARLGGVRGLGVMATPGQRIGAPRSRPGEAESRARPFRSQPLSTRNAYITGITRNSTGVALGDCIVQLFRTRDDAFVGETVSDGAGNYSLFASGAGPFYLVAYKAGAPDVAGTSVNTLVANA